MGKTRIAALVVAAWAAFACPAHAATYYWDTNGTTAGFGTASGTWGTDAWWNTDVSGGAGTFATITDTRDLLNFGTASAGLGAGSIAVSGAPGFSTLTFGSASGAIALTGGTLGMLGTASTITVNSATATIGSQIQGWDASLTKNGTGTLVLSVENPYSAATTISAGTLRLDSALAVRNSVVTVSAANGLAFGTGIGTFAVGGVAGAQNFALTDTGSNAVTLNVGVASSGQQTYSGVISGAGSLAKFAGYEWLLQGANTYTGATTVNGGAFTLNGSGRLVNTSGVTVNVGGIFNLGGSNRDIVNNAAPLTLAGGRVTLWDNAFTEEIASTTLNPGASSVTRGSSTLLLRMNTITRNVGGTINFATTGLADTDNTNTNGILGGWATFSSNGWAINSTGAANGAVTALASYTNDTWAAGNNTTVTTNSAPASGATTNSLRFNNAGAFTVTLSGANTISSGGILNTAAVGANTSTITGGTLTSGVGDLIVHQFNANPLTIAAQITGAIALTKSGTGAGAVTLSGANDYTGNTFIGAGIVSAGVAENAGVSGPFGNPATPAGSIIFAGGTLQFSASNTFDYSSRFTTSGNGDYSIDTNGQSVTLAQALSAPAGSRSGLSKSGTGTLTLGGSDANTFIGTTSVTGGTLALNKPAGVNAVGGDIWVRNGGTLSSSQINQIPDTASVGFPDGGGTWNLNNNNETINALVGSANAGAVVDLGSATLTIGGNGVGYSLGNGATYFGGRIRGTGGLIKNGTNYQRLDDRGTNSDFSGTVVINNGVLGASVSSSLGSSAGGTTVNAGGTLGLDNPITISNESLTLNGLGFANGGALRSISSSQNWTGPITLGSSGVLIYTTNGTLTLSNANTITGTNTDLIFDGTSGTGNTTVSGAIALGTGSLTVAGGNLLTLSGANTYAGGTRINGGTLLVNNAGAVGSTGNLTFAGGTLRYSGSNTTDYTARIRNSTGAVAIDTNSQAVTYLGALDATNTGGLTKVGAGTLTLAAANTYSGATTLTAGTIGLGVNATGSVGAITSSPLSTGTLTFNGGGIASNGGVSRTVLNAVTFAGNGTVGDATNNGTVIFSAGVDLGGAARTLTVNSLTQFNGQIQGTGGGITKAGTGTLVLGSTANSYTGTTIVNDGVLRSGASNVLPDGSAVTVAGSNDRTGTLDLNGFDETIASLTLGGGNGQSTAVVQTGTGTLTLNGTLTYSSAGNPRGSTISGNLNMGGATPRTFDIADSSNAGGPAVFRYPAPEVAISAVVSNGQLRKTSAGILGLTAANTYAGGTTIEGGTLRANDGVGLPTTGNLSINGGTWETSAVVERALGTGSGQMQIPGGTSGFAAFGGSVQVAFGTVASPTALTWGGATFNPTTFVLNGGSAQNAIEFVNAVDLGNATRTVSASAAAGPGGTLYFAPATMSGVISNSSGTGNFTKSGSGMLILTATNTYNGTTAISAGTLRLSGSGTLGNTTGGTTISNGAALELNSVSASIGDAFSNVTGTGVNSGGAIRNIAGNNTITGLVTLTGATRINSDAGTLTFDVASGNAITGAQALTLGGSGNITINDQLLSGAGSLTKTDPGTVTLNGAQDVYTGGTTVSGGTLLRAGAVNMPTTGTLAVNAGGNFSLADGTVRNSSAAALTLGVTSSVGGSLTFDWDSGGVDRLTSTGTATTSAGAVGINMAIIGSPLTTGGTLLSTTTGSLGNASYYLANATNYTATLTRSSTSLSIAGYSAATPAATYFWAGNRLLGTSTAGTDNALAFSNGTTSNWSTTQGSYTATALVPGPDADVVFSSTGAAQQSAVLGADMSIKSFTNNDSTAVSIGGSNSLTIGSGGVTVSSTANATTTFSTRVTLGAPQSWNVASGKALVVSGIVSGDAANSLTKAGAGTVRLSNVGNNFFGDVIINEGTLNVQTAANNTVAPAGQTSFLGRGNLVFGGGTLQITQSGGDGGLYTDRVFTIGNANGLTATIENGLTGDVGRTLRWDGTGAIAFGGSGPRTLTLTGTHVVNNEWSANSFSPRLGDGSGGATSFVKSGTGQWQLWGVNTYTGTTTLNAGVLSLTLLADGGVASNIGASSSDAANLVLSGGTLMYLGATASTNRNFTLSTGTTTTIDVRYGDYGTNTVGANNLTITGGGAATTGALTKAGVGTLTLAGTNLYTGLTTVSAGILSLSPTGTLNSGNALTVSGGTFDINGQQSQTLGLVTNNSLVGNSGAAATLTIGNGSTGSGTWTGAMNVTWNQAASSTSTTGNWVNVGDITLNATGAGTIQLNTGTVNNTGRIVNSGAGSATTTIGGVIGVNVTDVIQNSATSQLTLSGTNLFAGTTRVDAGTLSVTGSINRSATLLVNGGSLTTSAADKLADTAAVTVAGGTLSIGGADTVGSLTMSGGTIGGSQTLTAATYELSGGTVTGNLGAGLLTTSGNVSLNGTAASTNVNVTAGTLTLGSANRLADAATVTVSGGTLALGGFSDTVASVVLNGGSITSSTGVLTGSSYSVMAGTVGGILGGSGSTLTKSTGGTVTLTAANTYSGATNVNDGTLAVGPGGTINSTSGITVGQGTFLYNNATTALAQALAFGDIGGTIGGTGRIGVDLVISAGNTLSPGASPGTLSQTGNQTWAAGGNYNWQIFDATGTAGTGWDLMNITGTLEIASGFNVNLWSLSAISPGDVNGNAINFDPGAPRWWVIATASGGLLNPENLANANVFRTVNNGTGGFTNTLEGTFTLVQGGSLAGTTVNDVVVQYVPEPGTALIGVAVACAAGWLLRSRRDRRAATRG